MKLSQNWRPPGWQHIEEGVNLTPDENQKLFRRFGEADYYKPRGGALSPKGAEAADSDEAVIVRHNDALLRDAWNTHPGVWALGAKLIGREFVVDPFNNPGTQGLNHLVVKLNGCGDQDNPKRASNGLLESDKKVKISSFAFDASKKGDKIVPKAIELPLPANWRGQGRKKLKQGEAPTAINGPHSCVEQWLKLSAAQGQQEIVVAFVPDNGDGWYQRWSLTAQLVVHLGRVKCSPAPAIEVSQPRGSSALLIWVPEMLVPSLPAYSRKCVEQGAGFRVPLIQRPRAGIQYATVQSGALDQIVDLGLV